MKSRLALKIILVIALGGAAFSGVLSYQELFQRGVAACPSPGAPGTLLGYPACVYGFFMYLLVVIISAVGLFRGGERMSDKSD